MARAGRPKKEFDIKAFQDLVGLGCTQEEICWYFRDDTGRCANIDTLSRWCKRTFGLNFQDYFKQNGYMALKIKLRRNQFKLSEKSAAMAIWLGKQYLGQTDYIEAEINTIQESTREQVGLLIDELDRIDAGDGSADTPKDTI